MMTCTNLMIQLPFLRPNHPLKAKPGATQQERFEANAAMLGEMRFTMGLMMECIMHIGQLSRLDRELMMLSGQLNRTAALLTVCDRVGKAGTADAEAIRDDDGGITFDKVTVRSPTGRTLIEDLSFSLATGGNENMLVVGEPGVGKTSILRTLRGLWPAGGGRILRPATGIIYCPQTPYLVPGCALQDHLTYPTKLPPMDAMESVSGECPKGPMSFHLWKLGKCKQCGVGEGYAKFVLNTHNVPREDVHCRGDGDR